jgi:imidazolonepropionase-like amidohydrolase
VVPGVELVVANHPATDPVQQMLNEDDATVLDRMRRNARRALRAGITTVRDLGDRDYLALSLRDCDPAGPEPLPEILAGGPPITPTGGHCWFLGGQADGIEGVTRAVAERAEQRVDIVKIMATGGRLTLASACTSRSTGAPNSTRRSLPRTRRACR